MKIKRIILTLLAVLTLSPALADASSVSFTKLTWTFDQGTGKHTLKYELSQKSQKVAKRVGLEAKFAYSNSEQTKVQKMRTKGSLSFKLNPDQWVRLSLKTKKGTKYTIVIRDSDSNFVAGPMLTVAFRHMQSAKSKTPTSAPVSYASLIKQCDSSFTYPEKKKKCAKAAKKARSAHVKIIKTCDDSFTYPKNKLSCITAAGKALTKPVAIVKTCSDSFTYPEKKLDCIMRSGKINKEPVSTIKQCDDSFTYPDEKLQCIADAS